MTALSNGVGPLAEITIYTRQMCSYCSAAKALLLKKGAAFTEHDATFHPDLRAEMIQKSGRSTFPQIFIGGKHIGGFDDINALNRAGSLDAMLNV
jgi:glutaredoxin 3